MVAASDSPSQFVPLVLVSALVADPAVADPEPPSEYASAWAWEWPAASASPQLHEATPTMAAATCIGLRRPPLACVGFHAPPWSCDAYGANIIRKT